MQPHSFLLFTNLFSGQFEIIKKTDWLVGHAQWYKNQMTFDLFLKKIVTIFYAWIFFYQNHTDHVLLAKR